MARKTKQVIDLYGRNFTIVNGEGLPYYRTESIFTAYEKPSTVKVAIWNKWLEWKRELEKDNNLVTMWVSSFNCSFFTIGGKIVTPYGDEYGYYITATRQELWNIN